MPPKMHDSNYSLTPGQLLMAAREARSFTQSDIAKQTRLSVQAVHDIEQDAYAQLGVRTFVRGYLCAYARIVGIPESQILEALEASGLMPDPSAVAPATGEGAPVTNVTRQYIRFQPSRRWIVGGVSGIVLLAAVAMIVGKKDSSDTQSLAKNSMKPAVEMVAEDKSVDTAPVKTTQVSTNDSDNNVSSVVTADSTPTKQSTQVALNQTADTTINVPAVKSISTTPSVKSENNAVDALNNDDGNEASKSDNDDEGDVKTAANADTTTHPAAVKSHPKFAKKTAKKKDELRIQPSELAQSHTTYTITPVSSDGSSTHTS